MTTLIPAYRPEQTAGSALAALLRWLAARAAAIAAAAAARAKQRRALRRLGAIDDHLLRDIGLTRHDLYR